MAYKLYRHNVERIIKSAPQLDHWEEDHVRALFEPYYDKLEDRGFFSQKGITKQEWLEIYQKAKENKGGIINPEELEHLHGMVMRHYS